MPGIYVGTEATETDDTPFEVKVAELPKFASKWIDGETSKSEE